MAWFDWEDEYFASDYFDQMYMDMQLSSIKKGKAYVCDLNADEIRETIEEH